MVNQSAREDNGVNETGVLDDALAASANSTHQTSEFSNTRRWMRQVRRRNARTKFVSTVDEDIAAV